MFQNLRFRFTGIFSGLLFCICSLSAEYNPPLRIDSDADHFYLRMKSRYALELPQSYYWQPMTYKKSREELRSIDSLFSNGKLTKDEALFWTQYTRFLAPGSSYASWADSTNDITGSATLSLLGEMQPSYQDSGAISLKGIIRPSLTGNAGNFSFYSSIDVWTEHKSDTLFPKCSYEPYYGVPYNLYGRSTLYSSTRSSDLLRGGIHYTGDRFQIETAIDYFKVGPSLYYPLLFSGTAPPVLFARGMLDLHPVNYTQAAGLLKAQKDKSKYFYVHRIDADLWQSRLHLGINEIVINGSTADAIDTLDSMNLLRKTFYGEERTVEWAYCIPFVPYKFVEHYSGDRDNAAISFDVTLFYPQKYRWYLEFLLDDISSPWHLFGNDWGNKWALTTGINYFGNWNDHDYEMNFEYSHVEPWVYTHTNGASHNFTHFGKNLGSPLGPNSQAVVCAVTGSLNPEQKAGIHFTATAQNKSARGGKISDVFQDTILGSKYQDSTKKKFLGPGTQWRVTPSLVWSYNPYGFFTLATTAGYEINSQNIYMSIRGSFNFLKP